MVTELTGPDVQAVVRVHADRLHDAVRRGGTGPVAAVEVVRTACLDLVEEVARRPGGVVDATGWLFSRARQLGGLPAGPFPALSQDDAQVRLVEALAALPEDQRTALLLRDCYDLPAVAVGAATGLGTDQAMDLVGTGRLAFLPLLLGAPPMQLAGHPVEVGALARLATERTSAARDATVRRHAQSCDLCSTVLDAQERARRLLRGLTVVGLPDRDRDAVLAQVGARTEELLPAAAIDPVVAEPLREARRAVPLSVVALGLLLAVLAGAAGGAYASRRPQRPATRPDDSDTPLVTAAPPRTLPPAAGPGPGPAALPSTRVFTIAPVPTPTPSPAPTPSPSASPTPTATPSPTAVAATLTLQPAAGPDGTSVTVTGAGWPVGSTVTLDYLNALGAPTGSTASATVDLGGRFTARLVARDPAAQPGPHAVRAQDGAVTATATFTQTG